MLESFFERVPWLPVLIAMPFFMLLGLVSSIHALISSLIVPKKDWNHQARVSNVQRQVKQWRRSNSARMMCTARSQYKSISPQKLIYKDRMHGIKIDLDQILELNSTDRTVTVEPMVSIGRLNDYLIKKGFSLPVVPELDELTIGGLVMGGGIETTSHKYGLFQHICRKYELVLASGEVVWCSAQELPELFMAVPFSYGTLGFLTSVTLDIIEFKPVVHMKYYKTNDLNSTTKLVKELCRESVDSVEAFVFSEHEAVVMAGIFKENKDCKVNPIHRWYKSWFHHHARNMANKKDDLGKMSNADNLASEEYLPTRSFLHRHNRSCFWILDYVFPHNFWFRSILGWCLPPNHSLLKFVYHTFFSKYSLSHFVAQDFIVNIDHLEESLREIKEITAIFPIWICPLRYKVPEGLEHLTGLDKGVIEVDIGVYGFTSKPSYDKVLNQRRLERFFIDRGGHVALYAETELDEDEFAEMMGKDLELYEKMRKEYGCQGAFPHVYDKISSKGRKRLL